MKRPTSAIEAPSRAPQERAAVEDAPCPEVATADLELPAATLDTRTIALARLVYAETSRARVVGRVPTFDLGEVVVARSGPPSRWGAVGLGWMGLQASWVASSISREIEPSFQTWRAAEEVLWAHQHRSYLLGSHVRHARTIDSAGAWGGPRCLERAAEAAERDVQEARVGVERTAEGLRAALEALSVRRSGDSMLLAYVLADALPVQPAAKELARVSAIFSLVADDETADRELRARAVEQLARIHRSDPPVFTSHLKRVLTLTRDPELAIETLVKLADSSQDPREAERLRVEIVRRIEAHEDDWRLPQTLAALAENRLDRGAFALARDDAIRCAQASANEFPHDGDPWGCAPFLADALAEVGGKPPAVEIPLRFIGPLALASMHAALDRHDRDQALHAGRLLLEVLPSAKEAPAVLDLLIPIAPTATERGALANEKARTYGREGSWAASQRWALAWDFEPKDVDQQLGLLIDTQQHHALPEPTTPEQLRQELHERATNAATRCEDVLAKARHALAVRVDTTGATPKASVRGGTSSMQACLRRSARAQFRSLDPLRVSFRVAVQ